MGLVKSFEMLQKSMWTVMIVLLTGALAQPAHGQSPAVYATDLPRPEFDVRDAAERDSGRHLVDVEVRDTETGPLFSGIWSPVNGDILRILHTTEVGWNTFVNIVEARPGRWLDVEVGIFDGEKRWSGIFLEDGDQYGWRLTTTNTDQEFQSELDSNFRAGRQIVDFEAYVENGETLFGAVWQNDPNQPRTTLYYGLKDEEVNDLFNPQFPIDPASGLKPLDGIAGRPIDFECYWSTLHGEYRYAVIMAMYPGHEWALWFGQTESELSQRNLDESDADTQLIDLEVDLGGGSVVFAGVWGDTPGALHEVAAISDEIDPQPLGSALESLIAQFETSDANGPLGVVGFYAKNLHNNQSIGYRSSEPFYLASTSKIAIHIRLWQLFEAMEVSLDADTLQYTLSSDPTKRNSRNPWYVDNRDPTGLGPVDFGQAATLRQLDSMMLVVSDNAATSMLLELEVGRESLNTWLAGVAGVGRGFGPITGITDLDRVIMWQGQVNDLPGEISYFLIPSWRWEPLFRNCCPTPPADVFGDMQAYANQFLGGRIPRINYRQGHLRYFRMGLNSAEPRAFGRLLEKFVEGEFLDATHTQDALAALGSTTPLDDLLRARSNPFGLAPLPSGNSIQVRAKNGGKGATSADGTVRYRVANDVAIVRKGPETIVMGVFTKENSRPSANIRGLFTTRFGYHLFRRLIADLKDRGPQYQNVSSTTVQHNERWSISVDVLNTEIGDATPYKVDFFASTDLIIDNTDYLIGRFHAPTVHPGRSPTDPSDVSPGHVLLSVDFPASIPLGEYFVGWIIDPENEVGEWDDRLSDNTALLTDEAGHARTINVIVDCNANGVDDSVDLAIGSSQDVNSSGVPDECETGTVVRELIGTAQGGQVTMTVTSFADACTVVIATSPGQSAAAVSANLAAALNADACLSAQGVVASASGNLLSISGLELSVSHQIDDPGLMHVAPPIPTLPPSGLFIVAMLLLGVGWLKIRLIHGRGN